MAIVLNPQGVVGEVPDEQVSDALAQGYTRAPADQAQAFLDARDRREKYGTLPQELLAGGESLARTLSFGTSTIAERALGVDPEGIAGREEVNPVASGVGTAIGVAAPALLTGGGSGVVRGALAEGADIAAPTLIGKVGRGLAGALEGTGAALGVKTPGLLPQATTALGAVLRKGASEAVAGAAEGALYGAGDVVHEAALGDPKLNAESALATVGLSALLGGTGNAIIGAGSGIVSELAGGSAGTIGDRLAEWLGEAAGSRNIKAAGAIQSDLTRAEKQIGKVRLNKIGQEMGDLDLVSPTTTPRVTAERADALQAKAGAEIGNILKTADQTAAAADLPSMVDVVAKLRRETLAPLAANPLEREAASRLDGLLTDYETRAAQQFGAIQQQAAALGLPPSVAAPFSGKLTFEAMHQLRRDVSDTLYGLRGNLDPFANKYRDALHDFRSAISDEIESGLKRAGQTTDAWKTANRQYEVASRAAEFAEKGMRRAEGNNLVSLTELMTGLSGGVAAGPIAGVAAGAGAALLRRHASGTLGALAGAARDALSAGVTIPALAKAAAAAVPRAALAVAVPHIAHAVEGPRPPPRETALALNVIKTAGATVADRIESAASTLVRRGAKAGNIARSEALAGIGKWAASEERTQRDYKKDAARVRALMQSPDLMMDAMHATTRDVGEHAPKIAQAMQATQIRAVQYLATKIPERPDFGPLAPKWEPSAYEMADFNRAAEVADDPLAVLKQAAAGTLTPDAVDAMKAIYPQQYAAMQTAVFESITTHGAPPYQQAVMLSMLFGVDLDGTIGAMPANQAAFASAAMSDANPAAKVGGDPAAVHLAERSATDQQRRDARV